MSVTILAAVWFAASLPLGICVGKALKALSHDWHEAKDSGQ